MQQASNLMTKGDDHLLTTIQEHYSMSGQQLEKKQGVSGKSIDPGKSMNIPKVDKDARSRQLIKEALAENDFLKNLSSSQIREVVDYMELKKVSLQVDINTGKSRKVIFFHNTEVPPLLIAHMTPNWENGQSVNESKGKGGKAKYSRLRLIVTSELTLFGSNKRGELLSVRRIKKKSKLA